jgi:hypothetical protein
VTASAADAGLGSDGLVRPVNAPSGQQVLPGVQPGVSGQVVLAQYVIIFSAATSTGTGGGLFIYVGSPAPGNAPVFSMSDATEDPYGNAIAPGIWAGQYGQVQAGLEVVTSPVTGSPIGQLAFPTPSITSAAYGVIFGEGISGNIPILRIISALNAETGPYSDRAGLQMQGNPGTAGASAGYFGIYADANGGLNTHFYGNYSGWACYVAQFINAVLPGTGTSTTNPAQVETWHAMTLANGWAQVSGGMPAQYRLLASPSSSVQVRGNISGAAATSGTFATLPAGYVPAHTGIFQMQPTSLTAAGQYYGQAGTDGTLAMEGGTRTFSFNLGGIFTLDS